MTTPDLLTFARALNFLTVSSRSIEIADVVDSNVITENVADNAEWQALCDRTQGLECEYLRADCYGKQFFQVSLPEGWRFQSHGGISLTDAGGTVRYDMKMY